MNSLPSPAFQASLAEKYRPRTWADVVGQDKLVKRLQSAAERGALAGRAYWFNGSSGTGKSSLAEIIASEVSSKDCTFDVDADSLSTEVLEGWIDKAYAGRSLFGGYCFIVNEAHGLRATTIRRLLQVTDSGKIPPWVTWIFTTTNDGEEKLFGGTEDPGPLLSRCQECALNRKATDAIAERVREIAVKEGLDGRPPAHYKRLAMDKRQNMRAMLQAVESGWGKDGD